MEIDTTDVPDRKKTLMTANSEVSLWLMYSSFSV